MSADEPNPQPSGPEADEEGPQGVFGNLPQTRPGARSPRRDAGSAGRTRAKSGGSGKASAASPRRSAPKRTEAPAAEAPGADIPDPAEFPGVNERAGGGGGIEDVAWAGVAAAAEAATIGVRLATRALEAMRDAVERR